MATTIDKVLIRCYFTFVICYLTLFYKLEEGMMETYQDCVKKAAKIGVHADEIAQAFGIKIPTNEEHLTYLRDTATQEERWQTYIYNPIGSPVRNVAVQSYIDNATQPERWRLVYHGWLNGIATKDEQWRLALLLYFDDITDQHERWEVIACALSNNTCQDAFLMTYLNNATTQMERNRVIQSTSSGSPANQAALQAFLDNATTDEERRQVFERAPVWSSVRHAAIRALCSS